jgi:hypothetical protein
VIVTDTDEVIVIGETTSNDFYPTANAFKTVAEDNDMVISKFKFTKDPAVNPTDYTVNEISYATLFGGTNIDYVYDIALVEAGASTDDDESITIVGGTHSSNYPVKQTVSTPLAANRLAFNDDVTEILRGDIIATQISGAASPAVNLTLTITDEPQGTVRLGETASYAFSVSKAVNGTDAEEVRVVTKLPAGLKVQSISNNCTELDFMIYCDLATLTDASNSDSVSFTIKPRFTTNVDLITSAHSQAADSDVSDNTKIIQLNAVAPPNRGQISPLFIVLLLVVPLLLRSRRY